MTRRRNRIDISTDILTIAIGGAKKSHIVYRANLNFQVAEKYLKNLQEAGLIAFPSIHGRVFRTTSKGKEYLDRCENLAKFIE